MGVKSEMTFRDRGAGCARFGLPVRVYREQMSVSQERERVRERVSKRYLRDLIHSYSIRDRGFVLVLGRVCVRFELVRYTSTLKNKQTKNMTSFSFFLRVSK